MSKRSKINILLAIILIIFSSFFYYKNNQSSATLRLTSLSQQSIDSIRIEKKSGKDIIFKKNRSGLWFMQSPYKIKAHQFRIKTLLSLSQTEVKNNYAIEALKLSDYALDKPRAVIFFNQTKLTFGKKNPLNNLRYILAGNQLSLINDNSYPLVNAQAASFIELSLITDEFKITRLELTDKKQIKHSSSKQALLLLWANAQAFSVHRYMPRKNLGQVTLFSATSHISFNITDNDPWLILARPELEIEYHLEKPSQSKLLSLSDA